MVSRHGVKRKLDNTLRKVNNSTGTFKPKKRHRDVEKNIMRTSL